MLLVCVLIYYGFTPTKSDLGAGLVIGMLVYTLGQAFLMAFLATKLVRQPDKFAFGISRLPVSLIVFLVAFSIIYFQLSHRLPDSFHPSPLTPVMAIYFTIVTFATVGYGDIYPNHDLTRAVAAVEIIFAMLYTVLVFGVVGTAIMYGPTKRQ